MQALSVLEKSLNYDWSAILCNETLEDVGQTNMPISWQPIIESPQLVQLLFGIIRANIASQASTPIKVKCAVSLQHLAFVRHAIFSSNESRIAYIGNFMAELTQLFQSAHLVESIIKERQLYKEVVPILMKVQINFQVRDLLKNGEISFSAYLDELFKFTTASYRMGSISVLFHASKLNHLWQRVYLEAMGLALPIKDHLYDLMRKVSEAYLDSNLALKQNQGNYQAAEGSDADDEDENFEKGQRT